MLTARWTNAAGVPYDISAAAVTLKIRATDAVAVTSVTLVGGGIVKDPVTFWLTARIAAGVVPAGLYRYDFHAKRVVDGFQINLLSGELQIKPGISPVA